MMRARFKKISRLSLKATIFFLLSIIIFGASGAYAWDNCPFGIINESYPGTCGRYIDTDNDNICDLSQSSPEDRSKLEEHSNNLQEIPTSSANESHSSDSRINYYFVPIAIILFILYLVTLSLSRKKKIKLLQHRKIWNVLLLITFLISGIFGIILAIFISYGIKLPFYSDLLFWHVEMGIAMAVISMFHVAWHWKYFKKMLIKN